MRPLGLRTHAMCTCAAQAERVGVAAAEAKRLAAVEAAEAERAAAEAERLRLVEEARLQEQVEEHARRQEVARAAQDEAARMLALVRAQEEEALKVAQRAAQQVEQQYGTATKSVEASGASDSTKADEDAWEPSALSQSAARSPRRATGGAPAAASSDAQLQLAAEAFSVTVARTTEVVQVRVALLLA